MIKQNTIKELKDMTLGNIEEHHDELWEYLKKVTAIRDYRRVFEE